MILGRTLVYVYILDEWSTHVNMLGRTLIYVYIVFLIFILVFILLQQHISPDIQKSYVQLCNGHPYALHLIGKLASRDYSPTTETTTTATDVKEEIDSKLFEELFSNVFDKLPESQKLLLFAVVVFDQGASLAALHYVSPSSLVSWCPAAVFQEM